MLIKMFGLNDVNNLYKCFLQSKMFVQKLEQEIFSSCPELIDSIWLEFWVIWLYDIGSFVINCHYFCEGLNSYKLINCIDEWSGFAVDIFQLIRAITVLGEIIKCWIFLSHKLKLLFLLYIRQVNCLATRKKMTLSRRLCIFLYDIYET